MRGLRAAGIRQNFATSAWNLPFGFSLNRSSKGLLFQNTQGDSKMQRRNRKGAVAVEYVVMISLIILISIGSLAALSSGVSSAMGSLNRTNNNSPAFPPNSGGDPID